jgi:hypothetical protein
MTIGGGSRRSGRRNVITATLLPAVKCPSRRLVGRVDVVSRDCLPDQCLPAAAKSTH